MFNFLFVSTLILWIAAVIGLLNSLSNERGKSRYSTSSPPNLNVAKHLTYLNEPTGGQSESPIPPLDILMSPYSSQLGHYRNLLLCCSQFEEKIKADAHLLSGDFQLSYAYVQQQTKRHRLWSVFPYFVTFKKVKQLRTITQEWRYLEWHMRNIETPKKRENTEASSSLRSEPRGTTLPDTVFDFSLGEFIRKVRENPQSHPVNRKQKTRNLPKDSLKTKESIAQVFDKIKANNDRLDIEQNHRFETLQKDYETLCHVYFTTETTNQSRVDDLLSEGLTEILSKANAVYASLAREAELQMERQVEVIKSR